MGLDTVELVFAVEDAFGIVITDEEASRLSTPGELVAYLEERLPPGQLSICHSQRAFYRLRSAVVRAFRMSRAGVRPDTPWEELLPPRYANRAWRQMQTFAGAGNWPRDKLFGFRTAASQTIGATANHLARRTPAQFKRADEGWTRTEIERVVRVLLEDEFAITTFSWTDHFVKDLGLN
jgi:hypothetical protein